MILKTRPREFAVDVDVACPKLECPIYQVQRLSRERRGEKWAEVAGSVPLDLSRDDDLRKGLVGEL